jgi:uncharacterized protein (DUF697 family)
MALRLGLGRKKWLRDMIPLIGGVIGCAIAASQMTTAAPIAARK